MTDNIEDITQKRAIVLSSYGIKHNNTLYMAAEPAENPFANIIELTSKDGIPKLSTVMERYKFHKRERLDGESVAEFIAALHKLSEHCAFGTTTDEMLRDRLICGIRNDCVQQLLLSNSDLTLEEAVNKAISAETVEQHLTEIKKEVWEESISCRICNKEFTNKGNLRVHYMIHTGEKRFKCDVCDRSFRTNGTLKDHSLIHSGERPFTCEICQKTFSRKFSLKKHQELVHNWQKANKNGICIADSNSAVEKRRHVEKIFPCDLCEKVLASRYSLEMHQRVHTGEKPFSCEMCRKSFSQYASLLRHHVTHTGARPYICDACQKCFSHIDSLKKHQLIHTGEKRYICKICDKMFSQNSSLTRHQITHTTERPHTCETCGKKFAQKESIRKHMRAHTGEKPYHCVICERRFSQNSSLKRHILNHYKKYAPGITHIGENHKPLDKIMYLDENHKPLIIPTSENILSTPGKECNRSTDM